MFSLLQHMVARKQSVIQGVKKDECSESIYRGHSAFYLVMLPGLQCTIFFTSEDRNWKENSRDQTDKVNQKTTKRHALRCGESLCQTCFLFSAPPSYTSPCSKHVSLPLDFNCQLEKRNARRWGEVGREIKREGARERTGDRHWQKDERSVRLSAE